MRLFLILLFVVSNSFSQIESSLVQDQIFHFNGEVYLNKEERKLIVVSKVFSEKKLKESTSDLQINIDSLLGTYKISPSTTELKHQSYFVQRFDLNYYDSSNPEGGTSKRLQIDTNFSEKYEKILFHSIDEVDEIVMCSDKKQNDAGIISLFAVENFKRTFNLIITKEKEILLKNLECKKVPYFTASSKVVNTYFYFDHILIYYGENDSIYLIR